MVDGILTDQRFQLESGVWQHIIAGGLGLHLDIEAPVMMPTGIDFSFLFLSTAGAKLGTEVVSIAAVVGVLAAKTGPRMGSC